MNKECYIGIDYGGYDGNTFCMCVLSEGIVKQVVQLHDEQLFRDQVQQVIDLYETKHILIEKHDNHKHKTISYEQRLHP